MRARHLALVLLLPAPALAQTFSATGGANFSKVSADAEIIDTDIGYVTRLSAGLSTHVPLGESFGLEFGGYYSQKGTTIGIDLFEAVIGSATLETDYLEGTALIWIDLSN